MIFDYDEINDKKGKGKYNMGEEDKKKRVDRMNNARNKKLENKRLIKNNTPKEQIDITDVVNEIKNKVDMLYLAKEEKKREKIEKEKEKEKEKIEKEKEKEQKQIQIKENDNISKYNNYPSLFKKK